MDLDMFNTGITKRMANYDTIVTSKSQTGSETVTSSHAWNLIALASLTATNCTLEKDSISARRNQMSIHPYFDFSNCSWVWIDFKNFLWH